MNSQIEWVTKWTLSRRKKFGMRLRRLLLILRELTMTELRKLDCSGRALIQNIPGQSTFIKGNLHAVLENFTPCRTRDPAEMPDDEYPLVLSTGRTLYHYNSATMTRRSEGIVQKSDEAFVEINKKDADKMGINGGSIVKVITKRGELEARAEVSFKVKEGIIWMPFHFVEASANKLTIPAYDNITMTAEYKVCSARMERI